ncbi:protein kinase [Streptomyces sp. NPDC005820]|uniref:serine/threonine-protein kinase n=1 Tax=Streptomyces sp. NPDC005820 TaxID=3157069 RepID=UPI0033D622A7
MAGETPDRGAGRIVGGRYRLRRTLGAGGMGRVWLAYDEELACEVAMKEISLPDSAPDAVEPAQRIARARSEARHAARLRGHPHVATVHDVVVHEGLPWIVMEYVPDAVDLQAVVRRSGPLPPAQVARIGLAVLDALTAGHRIGILHRDVKPANILLSPDASGDFYARVLLTDYGIALQPESREPRLTATAGILGTPGYLAPERARGEPPTPAADLFSLGAMLYASVEGRGPFDRHGDYATLTALLGEDPTPPARAGQLAPVILGLLVKDPVRRSSPEAAARALGQVARALGEATPPGQNPPAGQGPYPPPAAGQGPYPPPAAGQGPYPPPAAGHGPYPPPVAGPGTPPTPHTPGVPPAYTPGMTPTPHTPGVPPAYTPGAAPTPHTPGVPLGAHTPGDTPGAAPYGPWWPPAGSQSPGVGNPYALTADPTPPPGGLPPYGFGPAVGPPPPGGKKRLTVVALVVAVVLVVAGGAWAAALLAGDGDGDGGDGKGASTTRSSGASPSQSPTGPVLPYGDVVGLTEPLETGDCVKAVWSGTPFGSEPNLGVVDCADDWPDGQVVAVDTATDYADAKARGAARCAARSKPVVDALPDAGGYAVVPTRDGFGAAESGTPCLVLGRHVAIGGEVGRFRDAGVDLWVGQMSVGDCWIYEDLEEGYKSLLTDCAKPHTDQVIGTVQAPDRMSYKNGLDNATKLCGNTFESAWAPGAERKVFGWVTDEDDWKDGFTKIVCTVGRADNAKTTGKIPVPGAV